MKQLQISKYDPVFRTEDGEYIKDDWTSVSDIGKIYGGKLFTSEEYLNVESKYVGLIKKVLEETESTYLKVVGLDKYDDELVKSDGVEYHEKSSELFSSLNEGEILGLNDAIILIRLLLRENLWCYLVNKYVTIKFGYDYYMYITLPGEMKFIDGIEDEFNLYVKEI
jgi:hypothetical protein